MKHFMRTPRLKVAIAVFLHLVSIQAYAYDIAVENEDGKTIYYNYINEGTELEVTFTMQSASYKRLDYEGIINVPSQVTYKNRTKYVTSIGSEAFSYNKGLTSVIIPNSVKTIGPSAFEDSGLTSVTIPNSVTSIGRRAFYKCHVESMTIPNSVKTIGGSAFSSSGLKSITIGNGVTRIDGDAFDCKITSVHISDLESWCSISFSSFTSNPLYHAHHLYLNGAEVKDLVIPNSVSSFGIAFIGCRGLTSVTIPNSVTSIDDFAFHGCRGLTSVTIPNSVTSIGWSAFSYCSGLTSVTIPNSVTSIGWSAFSYCSGLTSILSLSTNPKAISLDTFDDDVFYNSTLYVPIGTKDIYKSTRGWQRFVYIEEGIQNGIQDIEMTRPEERERYLLNGSSTNLPQKGLNIIRYSDGSTKKVMVK